MFVASNKLSDLKQYFKHKLNAHFSESEIKLMFDEIVMQRLQLSRTDLLLNKDLRLSESDLLHVRTIAHRLLEHEPFQYIIGETEFCGLSLKCDARALIPRPETEELVQWIQESFSEKNEKLNILDLCTGSGCIALALKSNFQNAIVSALDVSQEALNLANENAQITRLDVKFFEHDLLSSSTLDFPKHSFDCWVSNPPYIPNKDKELMHANVLNHEPHVALFVDDHDALIFYRKIATFAKDYLKESGLLFFEIHEDLASEVNNLLVELRFSNIEIKKDLQGKNRMVKARA
jgi:release factor glutamine methyltransferase